MTYINHKYNNDTHLVETVAEFNERQDAEKFLPVYESELGKHVYLSRRATQEWRDDSG